MNENFILFSILFSILFLANVVLLIKNKDFFNPSLILIITFFFPMLMSLTNSSGLQSKKWESETISFLIASYIVWGYIPILIMFFYPPSKKNIYIKDFLKRKQFLIIRLFSFFVICAFFLENLLLSGNLLPFMSEDTGMIHEIHTQSLPVFGMFTKNTSIFIILQSILFLNKRNKIDLILILVFFIIPLTRLSRIEIYMSLFGLITLLYYLKKFKFSTFLYSTFIIIALGIGSSLLGELRGSQFGKYKMIYAEIIDYQGIDDIYGVASFLYGYFCLPFEDFNYYILDNETVRTYGKFAIMPLAAVFETDRLFNMPDMSYMAKLRNRATMPTAVNTALPYFYIDFGIGGSIIMLLYILLLLIFYYRKYNSYFTLIIYIVYLSAFSMSFFMAILLAPGTFRQFVIAFIPFLLSKIKL